MDFKRLKDPFSARDIEWRLQSCGETKGRVWGKCLAYVTNRAIQNRLDEVCGPENWKNEYIAGPNGGILCGLSIKVDGEWITKWDGAENTQVEAVKGGLSDSMKRSAVQWGMGRYLYGLEEGWANVSENGKYQGKTKEGKYFKWDPPLLPDWALPEDEKKGSNKSKKEPESKSAAAPTTATTADSPELVKAMETVKQYITDGLIDEHSKPKAEWYLQTKNMEGLQKIIDYIEGLNKQFDKTSA